MAQTRPTNPGRIRPLKETKNTFLRHIPIKIPSELVLSRLKFAKYKTRADKRIFAFISTVIDEGYSLIEPEASYEIFDIKIARDEITFVGSKFTVKSRPLARHLRGASKAALFACTIGDDFTAKVNRYVETGAIARATVLDAVGSEAAEALAAKVDDHIKQRARSEGYSAVRRFSPGYGDWSILDQAKILNILEADKIGLSVTKGCIMVPEKSVTACIGLIKKSLRPIRKVYEERTKPSKK